MTLFSHSLPMPKRLLQLIAVMSLCALFTPSYAEIDVDNQSEYGSDVNFSQAELDQILAPIALYPDTILSQVMIAATYPIEVVQADRWARNNTNIKGADAVAAVDNQDWDPSVKALVAFPDILKRMSEDIDWTQKLGDAFLGDEGRVMDSIQNLRNKAYASGSLSKVQHLKVQRDADEIIIEPLEERVVYVPVYDTRIVYGNWWWPDYPPVYWHHPASYVQTSGFFWGPSIFVGSSFYYSSFSWRERHVVVVDRYHNHGPSPVFYTGRSIVNYHGARAWQHQPTHRRGVAYYNNQTRERFNSRQESYRDSHNYRQELRVQQSPIHTPTRGNVRIDTKPVPERSEQLRERLNQRTMDRTNQQPQSERLQEEARSGIRTPSNQQHRNNANSALMRPRQQTVPPAASETNNLGANKPSLFMPDRAPAERVAPQNSRSEAIRNREPDQDPESRRTDNRNQDRSTTRPTQPERSSPRVERHNMPSRERSSLQNRTDRAM